MTAFTRRALSSRLVPPPPGAGPHDWMFLIDGREAGRCYRTLRPGKVWVWHWTLFETPAAGDADTLDSAQEAFRDAFGRHRDYLAGIWARRAL